MSGPALCGPTNALTSLQKHAFQDRQLQQDRLRSPSAAGPSSFQNFRGGANLNSEFDQFASAPSPFAFAAPPPPTANWAADFQRLHIAPLPQQHTFRPAPPVPRSAPWGQDWAAEFLRSSAAAPAPLASAVAPQPQQYSSQFAATNTYTTQMQYESSYYNTLADDQSYVPETYAPSPSLATTSASHQFASPAAATEQATDAAFDAAFAEAYRWTLESTQQDELDAISAPTMMDKGKGKEVQLDTAPSLQMDPVVEEKADGETAENDKDDSDELSKTAGQLLESLATNQSKKFQESNFLALMRKLRDKEVKVEGEKMVEVNASG